MKPKIQDRISEFEIESPYQYEQSYLYYEHEDLTSQFVPISTPPEEAR